MPNDFSKTYQYPNCGPWGITLDDELRTESRLNASFSQRSWEDARLDGCLPRPGRPLPRWPPPPGKGFIYPTMEKGQTVLQDLGVAKNCPSMYHEEPPFVECKKTRQRMGPVMDTVDRKS